MVGHNLFQFLCGSVSMGFMPKFPLLFGFGFHTNDSYGESVSHELLSPKWNFEI